MPANERRAACALHHRRQRGRRQEHADRAAAARQPRHPRRPVRRGRARFAAARARRRRSLAAHRRTGGRARARHHHRRGLSLLSPRRGASSSLPTRPGTSSTRATWSPARAPPKRGGPDRCAQRAAPAVAPPHLSRFACSGMSEIIVAINKMDLVGYDEAAFRAIRRDVLDFAEPLADRHHLSFVPISALSGTWSCERGDNLAWWTGPDAAGSTWKPSMSRAACTICRCGFPFNWSRGPTSGAAWCARLSAGASNPVIDPVADSHHGAAFRAPRPSRRHHRRWTVR